MRNTDRKMWFFLGSGDIILINFAFVLAYFLKFDTIALKENYILECEKRTGKTKVPLQVSYT